MLLDARFVRGPSADPALRAAVCVVGGGVAGITLALELGRAGVDVLLLESGGLTSDAAHDRLSRGESEQRCYPVHEHSRGRFLGGSSNLWGGWCRPLERDDVEPRAWVPGSGWPITYDELQPFYRRAHDVLDLGPDNYDSTYWIGSINDPHVRRLPFVDDTVSDSISQFSGRHRLGQRHRDELVTSRHVRLVLHATVTDVRTGPDARRVTGLEVTTLSGNRFGVGADQVVLATGGIENARLLLASNRVAPAGLGNQHDLVGRYFMDHPRLVTGRVRTRGALRDNLLYDIKSQDRQPGLVAHGTAVAANFVLSPEVVEREGLLHARAWLRSGVIGEDTRGVDSLRRLRTGLAQRGGWRTDHAELALGVARGAVDVARFATGRAVPALKRRTAIEVIAESNPDRDSRVTLGTSTDALGMRRARVDWRIGAEVGRTLQRTAELVADALVRADLADVDLPPLDAGWDRRLTGTWHHIGTTRMALSPEDGVVDPTGRVHGIDNLYVAGSSVFPSSGANFPTMTLTALALRLADHLAALQQPLEVVQPSAPLDVAPWPAPRPRAL